MSLKTKTADVDYLSLKLTHPTLLDCPSCGSFVSAKDLDMSKGLGHCSRCAYTFDISQEIQKDPLRRPEIVMPSGIEMLKLRRTLELVVDWFHATPKRGIIGLISGSFFWNLLLIPMIIWMALSGHFLLILFFSGHVVTGALLLLYLLAKLFNKTTITIGSKGIQIEHHPIKTPWNRSQFLAKDVIKQLFVNRYREKLQPKSKKTLEAYALSAVLSNDQTIELVRGLNKETQLYLEQEIERYLGIRDEVVSSEIDR